MEATQSNLVTCACNNCSEHLQFELQQAGQRIDCPHCGMETLLFVPHGPRPAAPPVHSPAPVIEAQGEDVFLNEGGITATKTRFMVRGQTYAIANATFVSGATIPVKRGGVVILILFGGLLMLLGGLLLGGDSDTRPLAVVFLALGLTLTGVGVFVLTSLKDSYAVILNTAGSEMRTCISEDSRFISRVVAALNEAVVSRG